MGPGVGTLKKDDHVIPLYTPECPVQVLPFTQDKSVPGRSRDSG